MKTNRASITAEGIALARAVESQRPTEQRICYDPLAQQFVSALYWNIFRFFVSSGYAERRGPGTMGFLVARERYIDDYLQASLDDGLEQLVILGAGYDSRAYRFDQLKDRCVFEVDHPATQQAKIAKLTKALGELPKHVVFVPIDFETQSLEQRLLECGYSERKKTLFIWQGVTQYLAPEAVDSTLAFVANHSGQGSSIVFDYMYTSLLDGTVKRGEVNSMQRYRRMTGEGFKFGIPEGTIGAFMRRRGFCRVKNVTHQDFKRLYFSGVNQNRAVAAGYAIVSAIVSREGTT
jgi:methyltransferase (TIGR00027 family)